MSEIDLQRAINLAAMSGDVGLMKQFHAAGADLNLEKDGLTPLLAAALSGDYSSVNEIILLGAKVEASNEAILRIAISQRSPEILKLLLRSGASVNGMENEFTQQAYMAVANSEDEYELSMAEQVISIIVEASIASLAKQRAVEFCPDCDFFDLAG